MKKIEDFIIQYKDVLGLIALLFVSTLIFLFGYWFLDALQQNNQIAVFILNAFFVIFSIFGIAYLLSILLASLSN